MSSSIQPFLILPRAFHLNQYICSSCIRSRQPQWKVRRTVSTAAQILKDEDPKPKDFNPKPLFRPIGVLYPPKPGENSGVDPRPWRQRRDDLFDYNKHLVRRKELYVFPPNLIFPVVIFLLIIASPSLGPKLCVYLQRMMTERNKQQNPTSATGHARNTIKAKPSFHPRESSVPINRFIFRIWWARHWLRRRRPPTRLRYYKIAFRLSAYTLDDGRKCKRGVSLMTTIILNWGL